MNWQDQIEINPQVLAGKPVICGTRLAMEFVVKSLTNGWTEQLIIENYPGITSEDIAECRQFAADEQFAYDPVPHKVVGTMRMKFRDGGGLPPWPYRTDD